MGRVRGQCNRRFAVLNILTSPVSREMLSEM